jgi:hypothetical protein
MGFPYDRTNNPLAPITWGKSFNYFKTVTPGSATPGTFVTNCDVLITFPTYTVMFWVPAAATNIQYSFNGTDVHGTLDGSLATAPKELIFQNRPITKIWFSGTGTVRVEAWATR